MTSFSPSYEGIYIGPKNWGKRSRGGGIGPDAPRRQTAFAALDLASNLSTALFFLTNRIGRNPGGLPTEGLSTIGYFRETLVVIVRARRKNRTDLPHQEWYLVAAWNAGMRGNRDLESLDKDLLQALKEDSVPGRDLVARCKKMETNLGSWANSIVRDT